MKKNIKFEEAYSRLAEINGILESDEVSLEDSLKYFEEGIELTKFCQQKISEAKQIVEQVEIFEGEQK